MAHRGLDRLVLVRSHRASCREGAAGETGVGLQLPAEHVVRQAVDGHAAQRRVPAVPDVEVGRVGVQQLGELDDEAVEDGLDAELAREHRGRLEQRRLLLDSAPILFAQARRVNRQGGLPRDGGREERLLGAPRPGSGAVEADHADHAVEGDDRRRQHRACPEPAQRVDVAERPIGKLGCVLDVRHGHLAALARGEVQHRQRGGVVAHRKDARGVPLGEHRHALALAAEANERAVDADRRGELLDCHAHDGVDVELGSHPLAHARDQTLALQRVGQGLPRGDPLECQRCLGG